jgi:hypothetical protein
LLASDDSLRRGIARPWRRLAGGGLTVRPTRGDHLSYVREHAGDAADALRRCLEERP